jgi:hypothetical protein
MRYLKSTLTTLTTLTVVAICSTTSAFAQGGWTSLYNGKNLDGWEEHSGKAKYTVEDGTLTGASVAGSGNSFLCTKQTFENFELELEFKCDPHLNSGVHIRSEVSPAATTAVIDGKTFKFAADRVHGYQCEIDMDAARGRMWTGGIYDEARRGWLFPTGGEKSAQAQAFSLQGRTVSKNGEWNKLRIVCDGPTIKTWLNGEPRATITDSATVRGIIALQVHGVGNDEKKSGMKVAFRNIRVRELPNSPTSAVTATMPPLTDGWQWLWDGKTSDGWRSARSDNFPTKGWTMKDGVLSVVGNNGEESGGGGDIITRKRYSNFELEADFKYTPGANSGIKIFTQPGLSAIDKVTGKPTAVGSAIGLEFQILDDDLHPDAKLGKNGNRRLGSLYDLIPAPKDKASKPVGEWNHTRIVSRGKHVEFYLNGTKTLEFDRGSAEYRKLVAGSKYKGIPNFGEWPDGHILLQDHGNAVSYRNIKIRELPGN